MRKYFLLGVAALLSASTANATEIYTVEAQAKVALSTKMSCSTLDWGTIYLSRMDVYDLHLKYYDSDIGNDKIIASGEDADAFANVIGFKPAICSTGGISLGNDGETVNMPSSIVLTGNKGGYATLINIHIGSSEEDTYIYGDISFTYGEGIQDNETFTGSFAITVIK
ncbi:MAG: hypothetical protein E7016_06615 [Alphaproteobacteria bacterium]|nr:hypothetical protein [Alphaproteobacteria bacterium]